jgi:hypothetical protein
MRYTTAILLFFSFVLTAAANGETVILRPENSSEIHGVMDGISETRLLMSFDLETVPKEAVVEFAWLTLTDETGVPWEAPFVPVIVGSLTYDWESTDNTMENIEGGIDTQFTSYRVLVSKSRAPAKFNLSSQVTNWLSGEIPNHGIAVMMEEAADLQDVMPSFNVETLKPTLAVRYFLPSGDNP